MQRIEPERRIGFCACLLAATVASLCRPPSGAALQVSPDNGFLDVYRRAEPITTWPLKKLHHAIPELKGLEPETDQAKLPAILAGVAQNLQSFWKDFADTTSVETIEESRRPDQSDSGQGSSIALGQGALPTSEHSVKSAGEEQFRYLMLLDPNNPDKLREYRTDLHGNERNSEAQASQFAKTSGFASVPQLFGARQQPLCDYRYLGTQVISGAQTVVVAFAQHVTPAAIRGRFIFGMISVPILVQGVAWIDPHDYHVVQMRTDLLAPQPSAGLKRVSTEVWLQDVKFRNNPAGLWLPREVNVALDLENITFTNRHLYSDYQLFSVTSGDKTQAPKAEPQ